MSFREIDDVLWKSIEPYLPPQKPYTGRLRANMRKLMNCILYVVITGCTWKDVPCRYGSKSTIHKFHLYLCEHDINQKIFNELLNKVYDLKKIDLSHCFTGTKDIPAKKGEISATMDTITFWDRLINKSGNIALIVKSGMKSEITNTLKLYLKPKT